MSNKQKFKSDAFEAIHSSADALLKVGAINKATMREFDQSCLTTLVELDPQQIKRLREDNHVSQPVFARYLNTSESTVQWNRGHETGGRRNLSRFTLTLVILVILRAKDLWPKALQAMAVPNAVRIEITDRLKTIALAECVKP